MDDHSAAARDFESMFTFLHEEYFPRVAFGPIYLSGPKTHVFAENLKSSTLLARSKNISNLVSFKR